MTERSKMSLSGMWLVASLLSLVLPVFLPSTADAPGLVSNSVGAATATMFLLSFPISLLGLPVMFFTNLMLGMHSNSIEGMYVNLMLLFSLGAAQWFWIVPRLSRHDPFLQTITLAVPDDAAKLCEGALTANSAFLDDANRTPVERVIHQD